MSDFFPSEWEPAWHYASNWTVIADAEVMPKAETIQRRGEALKLRWPLKLHSPGPLERGESLLLYGGSMVSESGFDIAARILSAQRRQDHHIACAEQVTGGAERCDCGVRPR